MPADQTKKAVIDLLRRRPRNARFMTELQVALRRSGFGAGEIDRAVNELESAGAVMIRDHFCADPHLTGVDLRIIALVETGDGSEPQIRAIREIDTAWDKWLAAYLANHRCG